MQDPTTELGASVLPRELEDVIFQYSESKVLLGLIQLVCRSWQQRALGVLKQRLVSAITQCGFNPRCLGGQQQLEEDEEDTEERWTRTKSDEGTENNKPNRQISLSISLTSKIPTKAKQSRKRENSTEESLKVVKLSRMHKWKCRFPSSGRDLLVNFPPSIKVIHFLRNRKSIFIRRRYKSSCVCWFSRPNRPNG